MKPKILFFAACAALFSFSGCKKTTVSTGSAVAAYSVDGIQTVNIGGNFGTTVTLPLTFTYHNSEQEPIIVSISGAPSFISMGVPETYGSNGLPAYFQGPWKGIPTFSLNLSFSDLIAVGFVNQNYTAGTYPITLTCTTQSGAVSTYTFNLVAN